MKESLSAPIKSPIFRETFNDEWTVRRYGGTPVSNPTFLNGLCSFVAGSSQKITYTDSWTTRSIRFILKDVTSFYCKLATGRSIQVVGGSNTVTTTGFSSATIYVNDAVSATITSTGYYMITVYDNANFTVNDLQIGYNGTTYGTFSIDLMDMWAEQLTASEVANLYNNKTFRNLPIGAPSGQGTKLFTAMVNGSTYPMDNFVATATGFTANGTVATGTAESCVSNSLGTISAYAPVTIEFDIVYTGNSTLWCSLASDQSGGNAVATFSSSLSTGHYVLSTTNTTSGARYIQFWEYGSTGQTYNIAVSNLKVYYPTTYKKLILSVDAF
jgi:hypothetical protein